MDYGTTRGNNVDKLKPLQHNPQFHNLSLASSIGCLFIMKQKDNTLFKYLTYVALALFIGILILLVPPMVLLILVLILTFIPFHL